MSSSINFPHSRPRRLRKSESIRRLVQETTLSPDDLILPIFVDEGIEERAPIKSLPGVYREPESGIEGVVKEVYALGIPAVILFGVSHNKDGAGSDALKKDGLLARMIARAKQAQPEMTVIADTCFCEYTDHGHCGPLNTHGDVDNDTTLENLARQAVVAAEAGADIIAPSGMMDGMVQAIRGGLDGTGHTHTPILSYAVKYASNFYGPFRDAAGCSLGTAENVRSDRKSYQMDFANTDESLREAALDLAEGADMLMVKPGLPYLDIIRRLKDSFNVPVFAYHVSGEYAMLRAAAEKGWLDYDACLLESLMAFKRAGCSGILTYGALDAVRLLNV